MKFFKMIIILSIVSVLNISNVFGKSECDDITGKPAGLNMITSFGELYFDGYNYAKKTNIKYSKSKMKKYILCLHKLYKSTGMNLNDKIHKTNAGFNYIF